MSVKTQIDEEEVSKILDEEEKKKTPKEQLKEDFGEIDKGFGFSSDAEEKLPFEKTQITLDRKTYDEKTDDELEEIAKNSLAGFYSEGIDNLKASNEKQKEELSRRASSLEEAAEKSKKAIDSEVAIAKENAKNDAISRGLARSSIIFNKLQDYDNKKIENFSKIESDLNSSIAQIGSEIDSLSKRLDDSLKNFDLSYAVKLKTKIEQLKDEQAKKVEEVLEYNNAQALKEAQFNSDQNEIYAKYLKEAQNKTSSSSSGLANAQMKKEINQRKYLIAKSYFDTLPKEQAMNELINEDFDYYKNQLGAYFYLLYTGIKNR